MAKKPIKTTVSDADFDFELYASGALVSKEDQKKFSEVYEKSLISVVEKQIVEGVVTAITKKDVVVSLGQKSEGVIPIAEFRYHPDLKVGEKVRVFVEKQEDAFGHLVLSHKTARVHEAWDKVNAALESSEIVTGYVKCRTKGGLIVDIFGIEAFLPGSQIDVKPIKDYDIYVGKNIELRVIKVNHEFKNIVVSHKALIEAEIETQKQHIISGLEKGQILEGIVKNMTSYGVFVDLGGVDGLIHITDLSWGRIAHPEEVVKVDEKIQVVILDFDNDKKRIALGLKQLTPHPWEHLDPNLKVGDVVEGKITQLHDYGAFMEIAKGIEGLIHVSEMSWSQHLRSAQDFFKVGEVVSAKVLAIEKEEHKISLSIKQLTQDPWEGIETRFPVGSKHPATIRTYTNYGVFAELAQGVDGIIHIEDLAWGKIKHPSEIVQLGQTLEVIIVEFDKNARRLHLGYKQLQENPWDKYEKAYNESTPVEGKVISVKEKHSVVALADHMEGTCPSKHALRQAGKPLQEGDVTEFKVIEVDKEEKRLILSHAATYNKAMEEEGKADKRKHTKKAEPRPNAFNESDILQELKSRLDK